MPHALVLDPPAGRMYWSELGYQPAIHTALMDRRNHTILVQDKLQWPVGLALDAPARRLYWCDSKLRRVESVSMDGRDRKLVREFKDNEIPATIALHENFVYVTVRSGKLYRLNKFGQGPLTVLVHGLRRPVGLVVLQQQQQHVPRDFVNNCAVGKNKCSHLCLSNRQKPVCVCPTGDPGKSGDCQTGTKPPRPPPVCWLGLCGKGTCVNIRNKATCFCPRGFTGSRCEITITPSETPVVCTLRCLNGGTCVLHDGKPKCNCLPRTMGELCDVTCALFSCSHGGTCIVEDGQFACKCRKGYRYVGNKTCALDPCFKENRNGELCGNLECVATNNTNEAMCRCPNGNLAKSCKEPQVLGREGSGVTPQIIVPVVMVSLLFIAVIILFFCRRRGIAKKTEYSGMTIQVGNPSFLYEEMLDYEDNNVHPEVDNGQEKATTFSNPVYESVYHSETSLGSEVLRDKDLPKVEFRRSKADFSNPVYEALLAHNNSRKPGSVFWGSAENMNGEASGDQAETDC